MTVRIFDLPCLNFNMTVGRDETWRDSWPYLDALGNPIPLLGADYDFTLRSLATGAFLVVASTGTSVDGLPLNGRVRTGGVAGNVAGLYVPRSTMLKLPAGEAAYAHQMQARVPGDTRTIARGFVTILQGAAP